MMKPFSRRYRKVCTQSLARWGVDWLIAGALLINSAVINLPIKSYYGQVSHTGDIPSVYF